MKLHQQLALFAGIVIATISTARTTLGQSATEPAVTLDNGSIVQLGASCSPRQLRLAVSAKKGLRIKKSTSGQEDPKVIEVSYGNVRDAQLASAFAASWELSQCGIPQALLIKVDDTIRKAGNYDLVLNLQPKTAPASPRLRLQIVHAAAKLELPDKLLVDQTEYWPFYSAIDKMRFDLRETTYASDVVSVGLSSGSSMQGTEMVTGKLAIDVNPPSSTQPFAIAGQTRTLNYDLSGNFPLGVVSGSVRFMAPELSDPALLNFEVRSHLTKWYVLLAIVGGLLLSWYLKVYLHNRIELADAVSKAATLLDKVQADWNAHHDQPFRDALTPTMAALGEAIDDHDAAAIGTQMTLLDAAWRGALQTFAGQIQEATTALDEIRKITDSAWILPPTALEILNRAKDSPDGIVDVADIQKDLARKDAHSAADDVVLLRQRLAEELRHSGIVWHENAIQYLRSLAEARAGIPASALSQFAPELEKNDQQLNSMKPEQLVAAPAATVIIQFLRDFEAEYRVASQLLRELALRIAREWTEFAKILNLTQQDVAGSQELLRLKAALDGFSQRLGAAVSEPHAASERLQEDLEKLQERWRAGLIHLAQGFQVPTLNGLIQHQDFLGAAQQIASAREHADRNVALTGDEQEVKEEVPSWPAVGAGSSSSLSVISSPLQFVGIPNPLSGLHFQSLRDLRTAKSKQTLMVGALIVLWAYGFYSRSFGGTWSDVGTIFFAAFGLDITLDALLSKIAPKSS
jgi:hypothetical protein